MVAPQATGSSLDILLRFQMDAAANDRVARGVSTLGEELKKIEGAFPGAELGKQTDQFKEKLKQTEEQVKRTSKTVRAEAAVLGRQAADIISNVEKAQTAALRSVANQIQGISNIALVGGAGILGGIFGLAGKYVKDAKEATTLTRQWQAATASLEQSQSRVGETLAEVALPLLEKAAGLADRASRFVASHPGIVNAALNTGVVLASLGVVGTLVSKGIKLVADVRYLASIPAQLTAAKLQDEAAKKQLEAALLRAKELGLPAPANAASAGGGLLGLITPVALIVAGLIASKYAIDITNQVLNATGAAKVIADAQQTILETSKRPYPGIITAARPGQAGAGGTAGVSAMASLSPLQGANFQPVLAAYEKYRQDDLAAVQQHYDDRKKITANALAAEQKVNADYAASVAKVRSQTTKALADAAGDFAEANKKAEIAYQQSRAQIVRDGNQEIEQLQQDLQERLRKNEEEHLSRVADLTASRDALGLAKERRRFGDEQAETRREGQQEIKQRRAEIAQRLTDLAQSYEQERVQRQADHQARIAEIQQQAQERLAELAQERAEELRQIQAQKIAKIRELDAQFVEERKRRYQYLIQQIRDLDASLLGEKRLKDKYNALMIQDLDKFLATYRARLGSLSASVPGRADGGYTAGLVRTGERGYEYVMAHDTTRAAESMIGGRLTQQGLLTALQGMGGGSSVVWNDQRRFDGTYTNAMREQVRKDTRAVLRRELQ